MPLFAQPAAPEPVELNQGGSGPEPASTSLAQPRRTANLGQAGPGGLAQRAGGPGNAAPRPQQGKGPGACHCGRHVGEWVAAQQAGGMQQWIGTRRGLQNTLQRGLALDVPLELRMMWVAGRPGRAELFPASQFSWFQLEHAVPLN